MWRYGVSEQDAKAMMPTHLMAVTDNANAGLLSGAPSGLVDLFAELEEFVIRDIARRVAKTGAITDTALWQTARLQELGAGLARSNARSQGY